MVIHNGRYNLKGARVQKLFPVDIYVETNMVSDFYICRNIYVCMLSTGNCWAITWCDLYLESSHKFCTRSCTDQVPWSVILGLTAIAQFEVFWQVKNKATPQHAETSCTAACSYWMWGTTSENVYEHASTQPPTLIEPSVPSSSATHCSGYSSCAIPNPTGFFWAVKISPWHGHNTFLNWPLHEDEWVSSLLCQ